MKHVRVTTALILGLGLSACGTVDVASRNAPFDATKAAAAAPSVSISAIKVQVPQSLRVSEANLFYPAGDIVWRGEPLGDRHQQVKALFEEGLGLGAVEMKGDLAVVVDIEVLRFHSLTEKARYTTGGVHSIEFNMTLRDPATGVEIAPTRKVKADLKAFGGARAIAAERNGFSQKYRVTNHLAAVIQRELGQVPQNVKPI